MPSLRKISLSPKLSLFSSEMLRFAFFIHRDFINTSSMNRLVLISSIFLLAFAACKSDKKAELSDTTAAEQSATAPADDLGETMFDTNSKPLPGIVGPETDQVKRVVRVLTDGYWYCEAFVRINDEAAMEQNKGRWYKFNPDFTYTEGRWNKETGGGSWSFEGKTAHLHLDAGTDLKSGEYKVMISKDEQVSIFVGTPRYLQNNMQMKMAKFGTMITELPGN